MPIIIIVKCRPGIVVNSSKWGKVCVHMNVCMYVCMSVCVYTMISQEHMGPDIDVMGAYMSHFAQRLIWLTLN